MRKSSEQVYKSFKKFGSRRKERVLAQGRGYREEGKRCFVLFGLQVFKHVHRLRREINRNSQREEVMKVTRHLCRLQFPHFKIQCG